MVQQKELKPKTENEDEEDKKIAEFNKQNTFVKAVKTKEDL